MKDIIAVLIVVLSIIFMALNMLAFFVGIGDYTFRHHDKKCIMETRWTYIFPAHMFGCEFSKYMSEEVK